MGSLMKRFESLFVGTLLKEDCKMIIVARMDIAMSKGKVGAQCAHAAIECYRRALSSKSNKQLVEAWLRAGQPKIVVRVPSERELLNLARDATDAGLVTAIIRDAGRTQLKYATISVLGIGPAPKTIIDRLTSDLKLL